LSHIEGDSALSLGLIKDNVGLVHCYHSLIHPLEGVFINEIMVAALVNDLAFLIHNSETLNLIKISREVHVSGEFVLEKQFTVDLSHGTERSHRIEN